MNIRGFHRCKIIIIKKKNSPLGIHKCDQKLNTNKLVRGSWTDKAHPCPMIKVERIWSYKIGKKDNAGCERTQNTTHPAWAQQAKCPSQQTRPGNPPKPNPIEEQGTPFPCTFMICKDSSPDLACTGKPKQPTGTKTRYCTDQAQKKTQKNANNMADNVLLCYSLWRSSLLSHVSVKCDNAHLGPVPISSRALQIQGTLGRFC